MPTVVELLFEPLARVGVGMLEPEAADLHGHDLRGPQQPAVAFERGEVQAADVVAQIVVRSDAFVVVDEFAAAAEQ